MRSCAVCGLGGGEDHHVPRGQPAHVERESRATLLIRASREIERRRASTISVGADDKDRTGDLLALLQVVGDGRVAEWEDPLGGVTPILVVAVAVVGAQVDQVQGRARVGVMVFAQIVFADPSVEVGRPTPAVETSTWCSLRVRLSPKSRFS